MVEIRFGSLVIAGVCLVASAARGDDMQVLAGSLSPARHSVAAPGAAISVTFDRPLQTSSVTTSSFRAFGRNTGLVSGPFSFSNSNQTVTLTPSQPFAAGETVTVNLSHDLIAADTSPLRAAGYAWQFLIATQPATMVFDEIDEISNKNPPFTGPQTRIYGSMAADLNHDGYIDLTTVNEVSDDLRVTLNTADGSGLYDPFLTPPLAIGHEASPNEQADFNNDGDVDICTASTGTDSVWIALGNGDGTFASPQQVVVGMSPHGIAALDVDGDGDWDIVNGNRASDDLSLLINNGSGVFGAPSFFDSEIGPNGEWGMAAGDMNNDGIFDLVVGLEGDQAVIVLLGNGNGTFTALAPQLANGGPWQVAIGDVDGDFDMDVTTANSGSGSGSVLRNNGTGTLGLPTTLSSVDHTPATDLGDLDGDGDLDWVLSAFGAGLWRIYENGGSGNFTLQQDITATNSPSCSALLDFDNDGDLDMALSDELADTIKLMRNGGVAGPSPTPTQTGPTPTPTQTPTSVCPPTPDPACVTGFAKGFLLAKNSVPSYEKVIAKLINGPEIAQAAFGNPLVSGGTGYSLCIYDDASALAGELTVDRPGESTCSGGAASCWSSSGPVPPDGKGYKYKDTDLSADGVMKILLKGGLGSSGKSKIIIKGKGGTLPASIATALTTTSSVTVQLRGDDAPGAGCFSVTLNQIKRQDSDFFKAK